MSKCYLCGKLLNEANSSVEHIIPNAIGGHLKSKNLLCKDCNSNTGELYRCLPGGVPSRIIPKVIKKDSQIIIKAPDRKVVKQFLNKFIDQNLSLDIDQIINNAEINREYIDNWCNI